MRPDALHRAYDTPVAAAPEHARAEFLRRVGTWTLGGLAVAGMASLVSMAAILAIPALSSRIGALLAIGGSFLISRTVASSMVYGESKIAGFVLGTAAQGVAMGWLLLTAIAVSASAYGGGAGGFVLIGQAGGMTALTVFAMCAYLWSAPKDLSMVRAALGVLGIPMLILMVVSFVFPIGGMLGLGLSALFVIVSGGGLLYQLNQVLHTLPTSRHVEASYELTLGMLVLFWNLLSLLTRLNRD